MLGSMVHRVLSRIEGMRVTGAGRSRPDTAAEWKPLDAQTAGAEDVRRAVAGQEWVVNAIGITKPLLHDDDPREVERGIRVNSLFPHLLSSAAEAEGARLIQIATDCVYSGERGDYSEPDPHDALDVYGKSKSLGEVHGPAAHHLRCSIIGPETKDFKFLLEWFRRQPPGARVSGYANHRWNGVTTLHFARIVAGIIRTRPELPHLHHVVPTGSLTKAEMLREFARAFQRTDVAIDETNAGKVVDRTLSTVQPDLNRALWRAAGYDEPPTVAAMIAELGALDVPAPAPA